MRGGVLGVLPDACGFGFREMLLGRPEPSLAQHRISEFFQTFFPHKQAANVPRSGPNAST